VVSEARQRAQASLSSWHQGPFAEEALARDVLVLADRADQLEAALRQAEPALYELIGWINTSVMGCVDVERRGEAALATARAVLGEGTEEPT